MILMIFMIVLVLVRVNMINPKYSITFSRMQNAERRTQNTEYFTRGSKKSIGKSKKESLSSQVVVCQCASIQY